MWVEGWKVGRWVGTLVGHLRYLAPILPTSDHDIDAYLMRRWNEVENGASSNKAEKRKPVASPSTLAVDVPAHIFSHVLVPSTQYLIIVCQN